MLFWLLFLAKSFVMSQNLVHLNLLKWQQLGRIVSCLHEKKQKKQTKPFGPSHKPEIVRNLNPNVNESSYLPELSFLIRYFGQFSAFVEFLLLKFSLRLRNGTESHPEFWIVVGFPGMPVSSCSFVHLSLSRSDSLPFAWRNEAFIHLFTHFWLTVQHLYMYLAKSVQKQVYR